MRAVAVLVAATAASVAVNVSLEPGDTYTVSVVVNREQASFTFEAQ